MEESEYIIDKFYSLHIKKTNIESELDKNKALENCLNKSKLYNHIIYNKLIQLLINIKLLTLFSKTVHNIIH